MQLDATQTQALIDGLIGFALAILTIVPFYVRARGKRVEALADAAAARSESDSLRSKASASRELLESDSLRFVLQVAQTSLQNTARITELERLDEDHRRKEQEQQKLLIEATQEIARLKARIVELEAELERYKKADHAQPESSTL